MVWVVCELWQPDTEEESTQILAVFTNERDVRKFIKQCFLTRKETLESIEESVSTVDVCLIDIHSEGSGIDRTLTGSYDKEEEGYNSMDYYNITAKQFELQK